MKKDWLKYAIGAGVLYLLYVKFYNPAALGPGIVNDAPVNSTVVGPDKQYVA